MRRYARHEEPCVEPARIDGRRHPVRKMDQRVEGEPQVLALENGSQTLLAPMQLVPIIGEPGVGLAAGERDETAAAVTGQQDAGFLEQLPGGRDMMRHRFVNRKPGQLRRGMRHPVAPRFVSVMVRRIDRPTREHMRSGHEGRAFAAPDHEHFGTPAGIAQHDHGRSQARHEHGTAGCHDPQ